MPECKSHLKSILESNHRGRDQAIKIRNMISLYRLEMSDRQIRDVIRELNMEGYPILSTVEPPFGLYWASSETEIEEYLCNLGSRAQAIHQRMAALSKIKAREFLKGQLELFG